MLRRILLVCVLVVIGAACAKSNTSVTGSPSAAPSTPETSAMASGSSCASASGLTGITDKGTKTFSGSTVDFEADNDNGKYYFDPSCARAQGTVTVTIKNVGSVEHNFSISTMNISKDIE